MTKDLARKVGSGLREEDFAFTVEAAGFKWDVYRFTLNGKRGTIAFKMEGEQATISVFQAGELTEEQSKAAIVASYVKEGEKRGNWVEGYVRNGIRVAGYYRGRKPN